MSECVPSPDSTPGRGLLPDRPPSADPTPQPDVPGPFDGGGTGVIRATPRSHSPPPRTEPATPDLPPRPHSSPSRQQLSISPELLPQPPQLLPQQHLQPQRNTPGVITSQPSTAAAAAFWVQNARINGVKPELIGGNFTPAALLAGHATADMKPPMLSPGQHRVNPAPLRQTPTVIMGEAGGVSG